MKYFSLCTVMLMALLAAGCGNSHKDSYTIEGKITNPKLEGRTVYIQDAITGVTRYDSATVTHGLFTFTGKQDKPVVRELLIRENDGDIFPVTLPFVLENATIEVKLGDEVYVGNTSLNKEMMEVLIAIDQFTNSRPSDSSFDGIRAAFASLLMEQITKHSDSPVGKYLYEAYQKKLTDEQISEAKRILHL